ncbi:DUF3592 domain-containing protein [Aromatoleum diolicum]|uniref:DUF3592 domain-containing protein n=1 Tax=Aromatoleum diolicum TaxID=75796 RepID=A0ABX1Q7Q9_9RHOO|nr:DUF3592 domain-containing protein [Aromatoleum diolicum]NMG74408.1 DUF3592 domain-containing protein [Aromatoleum diolicum]
MSDEFFLGVVLPVIFLLAGGGLLATAARHGVRTRAFLDQAREAAGEVVALEEEPAMEVGDSRTYRPVVAFAMDSGQQVRFSSMAHSNPPAYELGASVRVLYDPERPHEARIRSFAELWFPLLLLGGLGGIFTALGAAILLGYIPL